MAPDDRLRITTMLHTYSEVDVESSVMRHTPADGKKHGE